MKKYLGKISILLLLITTISCNGHFRFFVDPFPGMPVVIQPMSPGDGYIWIGGEWFWNGHTYMWRDGYWTRPLHGHTWTPGHWKKSRSGWYWAPGRWRR
jgi:hypothetical protein